MKLDEIKNLIGEFLDNPLIMNENDIKLIKSANAIMTSDIAGMIDGQKVEQNDKKIVTVIDSMMMISSKVLGSPINKKFANFVTAYSELAYNWNQNMYQDELLRQLPLLLGRIIESRNAMIETTKIMKDMDERWRDLSSWNPPAYEIAVDYFEKLLKENEKE